MYCLATGHVVSPQDVVCNNSGGGGDGTAAAAAAAAARVLHDDMFGEQLRTLSPSTAQAVLWFAEAVAEHIVKVDMNSPMQ